MAALLEAAVSPAPPITVAGKSLRAKKAFVHGTHRCVSPVETLERIRPIFRPCGITRVADITGLDRIGVTTAIAYRPNGQTLSSAAGKGFTREAALVSAAMEGIELHHAEHPQVPVITASYAELARRGPVIRRDRLPLSRYSLFRDERPEYWVESTDLVSGQTVPVPFISTAMIRHPGQVPAIWMPFAGGSNGLASGNHLLEAICAGLLEVIERDAVTCHEMAGRLAGHQAPALVPDPVAFPLAHDLIERFQAAQVHPVLFDYSADTDVPVYVAYLIDGERRHVGLSGGYGAHLDPEIAMVRALTEAAQSRLVYIAGARDDIFRHDDLVVRLDDAGARSLPAPAAGSTAVPRPSAATPSFEGDLAVLIERLRRVGLDQVLVVDLTHEDIGVPVVRVLVPGLEACAITPYFTPGQRAAAFVAQCRQ